MSRLRISYLLSLAVLGVLLVFTVLIPVVVGGKCSEVQREGLLRTEEGWVVQFDIINHDVRYI